jgi:hypothetical protein
VPSSPGEPGTITAIIGPSGSGKSTLVQLLPRFFDPTHGSVVIGGVDLRELGSRELYRMVSFVFQDVRLLRASVADNIALAVPHADLDDVVRAARLATIHDRILELPRGYETVINERALVIAGAMSLIGNTATDAAVITGPTIHGALSCAGNTPALSDAGVPNDLSGAGAQCGGLVTTPQPKTLNMSYESVQPSRG